MKKINLNQLSMSWNEKQMPQKFRRYAGMLIMLLTLGVGQMWAGQNINKAYLKASFNGSAVLWDGSNDEYTYNGDGHSNYDLGTLTGDFVITYVSWRAWADWYNTTDFYLYYNTDGNGSSFPGSIKQNWAGGNGDYYPKTTSLSKTVASVTDGSGEYDFEHYFYADFGGYGGGNRSWLSNGGSNYHFTYTILPPDVSSFSVTESNHLSGSGTSEDPYIMPYNGTLSLSISGSKAHTDANSSAQYYNTSSADAWSATATKSIGSITSTTKTSVTVKMRYYNSTAKLAGTESSKTIYYQAEPSYSITAAKTPSAGGSVTPTSATTVGTNTGGNITASPNTGYNFTSWAITSGSGYFGATGTATTSTTANTKFRPSANSTVTATFTAKTYTITLDKNGADGSDGSATATYNSNSLTSVSHPTYTDYRCDGYYTGKTDGTKIVNANGTLVASTSYTDASGNWTYDDNLKLYAHWTYDVTNYTVTYGVGTSYTSFGSISAYNNSTSAALGASPQSVRSGHSVTFTASPNTGYEVAGFYSDASCSSSLQSGNSTTYTTSISGATSVYVKFQLKTTTITLDNTNSTTGATSVTATYSQSLPSFTAHTRTGYTLNGYYSASSGGTKVINADGTLVASVTISTVPYTDSSSKWIYTSGTLTLYPQWTEKMTTVTVNVSPAGTGTLTVGGAAFTPGNTTTAGVTTSRTVVATVANDDYTFGSWSVTGNATGTNSTNTYTLKGNGSAGTGTLTANFTLKTVELWDSQYKTFTDAENENEMSYDLEENAYYYEVTTGCSPYYFRFYHSVEEKEYSCAWGSDGTLAVVANGSKQAAATDVTSYGTHTTLQYNGESGTTIKIWYDHQNKKTWITADKDEQYVLRGATEDDKVNGGMPGWGATDSYFDGLASGNTGTVSATLNASTVYHLKIYDMYNKTWYGKDGDGYQEITDGTLFSCGSGNDFYFSSTIAGSYTFTLDKSSGMKVKVDYPVSYTVNFGVSPAGAASAPTNNKSLSDGDPILAGTSVTFTKQSANSGYTWSHWEKNGANTSETGNTYTTTISANTTVNAVYTEDMHTVTVAKDATGGSISTTSVSAGIATASSTITATPANEAWRFWYWEIPGDGSITIVGGDNTNPSITIKATADSKTITAHFEPRFALEGSLSDDPDHPTPGGMPGWQGDGGTPQNFTVESFTALGTGAGKGVDLECECTLQANKEYKFQVWDRSKAKRRGCTASSNPDNVLPAEENWKLDGTYDVHIYTVGAGTYTFKITNLSDDDHLYPSLTVVRQASYSVTFGQGTGNGTAVTASGSTSGSITSGQYVAAGEDVTFTQAAATGYTFKGWYTASSGGTTVSGMSTSDNVLDAIAANANVYAQYTEDMHTVTLVAGSHGTITTPASGDPRTVSAGIATPVSIAATADDGYIFSRWRVTSGSKSDVTIADSTSASTTITATGDVTLTAIFISTWAITGSSVTFGEWSTTAFGFSNFGTNASSKDTCYIEFDLPANSDFTFKIYNHLGTGAKWYGNSTSGTNYMTYAANNDQEWEFHESNDYKDCGITTAGKGTYRFIWNISDEMLRVRFPESHTVSYDTKKVMGDGSITSSTAAGSISSVEDEDGDFTSGKYVVDGGTVTFTHSAAASNYHFGGWYSDATCETAYVNGEGGAVIDDEAGTLALTVSANAAVYAKFAENMCAVTLAHTGNGHIEIGGETVTSTTAGVATTRTITAVPDAGWYFAGWTVSEGADCSVASTAGRNDNASSSTTLSGLGAGTTGTVTAKFIEGEKIYFRNIFDDGAGNVSRWSDVYVYFDITWNEGKVKSNSNSSYIAHMSQIAGKEVYWAYVPRAFTVSNNKNVAFSDTEYTTNYDFYNATASGSKASARGDYSKSLNMFVPNHTVKSTNVNGVDYFDNGYWMKYDTRASQGAGYYLKKFKAKNSYWQMGEFVATADDATAIRFTIRVDNTDADSTKFMIVSAGGLNYIAESALYSTDYTKNVYENLSALSENSVYFQMNTDAEGDYTFVLDQSGDVMKLTVDYPVSPGDYRLKHTYNDGSAKTTYSDVIKSNVAESGKTLSMYLSTAGTETLVLQKCTEISEVTKDPVWSEGDATNLGGILTKVGTDGNSVYQFDITINTSTDKVSSVANIGKYIGNFYIKTDCADGGWINYTQNSMAQNTINFDPAVATTFDYYFCKWISSTSTNVKCVIANDYCNQISDTLKSDEILYRNSTWYETLPYAANVRFSYNSVTNELKRSYLLGSTDANSFLYIVPSGDGLIYTSNGETDLNSLAIDNTNRKFKDNGNWTYQMDVQIYPTACGGIYSKYPTVAPITEQHFLETSNVLMGGESKGTAKYNVRLIYDYKTNNLVAAWLPNGDPGKSIDLQSDFMMLRDGQNTASQLSITGTDTVKNAHRAYGAFEFKKDDMVGQMGSWNATSYALCMYYFSFPFDVNVSDIFGVGTMGVDWRIQRYNGKKRADQGWFAGDGVTTFWEDVSAGDKLNAYEGYSLLLNRVKFNRDGGENNVWTNIPSGGSIYLIFPSASNALGTIASGTAYVDVPSHECKIDRFFEQDRAEYYDAETDTWRKGARNHKYTDSHWNMVGAPVFHNLRASGIETGAVVMKDTLPLQYVYAWNSENNTLGVRQALNGSFTFNSMYAYMVQYTGRVTFSGASIQSSVAARRTPSDKHYTIELELSKDETFAGRAYVELRENAVDSFVLNEDMYMMRSSKTADIYTYAGGYDVSANVLSIGNHTIPVGVYVKSAGTYTFSMPNIFSGTVTLVDTYTQERTNLSLNDYEVTLPKGEINERFYLDVNVQEVITSIENVDGNNALNDNKAHKFIKNDQMYILKNGVVYDARGARVK